MGKKIIPRQEHWKLQQLQSCLEWTCYALTNPSNLQFSRKLYKFLFSFQHQDLHRTRYKSINFVKFYSKLQLIFIVSNSRQEIQILNHSERIKSKIFKLNLFSQRSLTKKFKAVFETLWNIWDGNFWERDDSIIT